MNDKDKWSAHLEYLKVAITLATALLAVAAAIYSDPSKIPPGGTKYILLIAAIFVFLTLIASIASVIFLSNYLIRVNQNVPDPARTRRITISAGFSFYLLMLSGLFILIFFSMRAIGEEPNIPSLQAMQTVSSVLKGQISSQNESLVFNGFELKGKSYLLDYTVMPNNINFQASVFADNGQIEWINKKGEAPPDLGPLTARVAKLEDRLDHLPAPAPPDLGPLTGRVAKLEDRLDHLLCPSTEAELTFDQKKQIQKSLSFSGRQVDGVFGGNTHGAIATFRRSRNVATTGELTADEIKELLPRCKP